MSEKFVTGRKSGILDFAEPCHDELVEISAYEAPKDRASAVSELMGRLVTNAKARFRDLALEKNISTFDLYRRYGIEPAYACRVVHGVKAVPTHTMAAICYDLLHISCHELVFNEPARIVIPTPLSAAVCRLVETNAFADRSELQMFLSGFTPEEAPRQVTREFLNDRLAEISDDLGLSLRAVLSDNAWIPALALQFSIRADFFTNVVPCLKRMIRFCMTWRRPLDWFLARDYTPYAELYYRDGDSILPLPNAYRTLVSVYLRLSAEDQVRMLAELLCREAAA